MKRIITDNGGEFFNENCSKLFTDRVIVHESICSYTPQQNGVVDRKHKHLLEIVRALRFKVVFLLGLGVNVFCMFVIY